MTLTYQLREYQQSALDAWDKYVDRGGRRGLIVLPTAGGKTVVFSKLPEKYGRTLVLAHREELLDQAANKLRAMNPGLTVGIEQGSRHCEGADLVVASVPTLGRAGGKRIQQFEPDEFKLVVIDEAHHASPTNSTYMRVLDYFDSALRLGVTATPQRGDSKGLIGVFDEVVYFVSIQDLIKDKWLVPPVGYRIKTQTDISGVRTRGGEFIESELADAVDSPERNQMAVDAYLELAFGRRAAVYSVNVEHGEHLEEMFRANGLSVASVFGHTDKETRRQRLADFASGKISVMVSCLVLSEGWDDPGVSCLILARPTRSALLFTQIIGRGLRLADGKDDCIILDMADACAGKKPVGLPTLMGLPPDFDLEGEKLHEVAARFDELALLCPEAIASVSSVTELEAAFERIDLFRPVVDPTLAEFSSFVWCEVGDQHWILNLRGEERERLVIKANALGQYEVSLERRWYEPASLGARDNMTSAFRCSDAWVKKYRGESLKLVDMNALWRSDKPSPKQLRYLKRFGIPVTEDMTKGMASLILDKFFGR
jgi:ATP-dependent helicase IRC3